MFTTTTTTTTTTIDDVIRIAQLEAVLTETGKGDVPDTTILDTLVGKTGKAYEAYCFVFCDAWSLLADDVVNPLLLPYMDVRYAIVASHLDLVKDKRTMDRVLAHDVTDNIVNKVLSQLDNSSKKQTSYLVYQKDVKKLAHAVKELLSKKALD